MGKYSDIVKSAECARPQASDLKSSERAGKNESGKPENQKTLNTDSQKTKKVESSKTSNVENQKAINTDNQKTRKVESNQTSNAENQETIKEDMVNLSIKVPRRLRQKWVAESRLRGTTLTAIITNYLSSELGE